MPLALQFGTEIRLLSRSRSPYGGPALHSTSEVSPFPPPLLQKIWNPIQIWFGHRCCSGEWPLLANLFIY